MSLAACTTDPFDETFTVGVWGPATIPDIRDAAELAARELNDAGTGAGGRRIRIEYCDSGAGPDTARAAACVGELVEERGAEALVGGFASAETKAARDEAIARGVLFLTTGAADPGLIDEIEIEGPGRVVFRVAPLDSQVLAVDMCDTFLGFAEAEGFDRYALFHERSPFAEELRDFLSVCLTEPGRVADGALDGRSPASVVAIRAHEADATEFEADFAAFEEAGAEFVIEVNSRAAGVDLVRAWGEARPPFALGGLNVSSQFDAFFAGTGRHAAYELNGPAGSVRAAVTERTLPFFEAFEALHERSPIFNGVSTYDAIHVLADAVVRAETTDTDAVVTALEETDHVGALGRIRFDERHDVVYAPRAPDGEGLRPVYFQWTSDGDRRLIFPSALAGAEPYEWPPWVER